VDTFTHLAGAGMDWVGAGEDHVRARAPRCMSAAGELLTVVGFTDHPAEFAARADRPGTAYADLRRGLDRWIADGIASGQGCVLVTPHWGPNMEPEPLPYVRAAARRLLETGATLVAGHSAHVVQAVDPPVLYDLGDFLDDYRVDPVLRNDLGLLFLVDVEDGHPRRLEAVPLKLSYCYTDLAVGDDAAWIRRRFRDACAAFGQEVLTDADGHLVLSWPADQRRA
jgi:poly-gamma-glutamate capsule biosynthesis protein CapA/YwtB (metallophosphatase superfamily)